MYFHISQQCDIAVRKWSIAFRGVIHFGCCAVPLGRSMVHLRGRDWTSTCITERDARFLRNVLYFEVLRGGRRTLIHLSASGGHVPGEGLLPGMAFLFLSSCTPSLDN
jgi:hypothetical protein